jgi:hypothetical protein
MTRYWVLALIVAVVAMLWLLRWAARRSPLSEEDRALVPHGDGERSDGDFVDPGDLDDTAPAVLSPPEWAAPRSVATGTRR